MPRKKKPAGEHGNTSPVHVPERVKGGRYAPGHSGNPAGKPQGSRHRASLLAESLIEAKAEPLANKVIELALAGDQTCLRIAMDRLAPVRRERPIHLEGMPDLQNPEAAMQAVAGIVQNMFEGNVSPSEANSAALLVGTFLKAVEASDIVKRLERIETQLKTQQNGQPRK
jgi:hypothetical protein